VQSFKSILYVAGLFFAGLGCVVGKLLHATSPKAQVIARQLPTFLRIRLAFL